MRTLALLSILAICTCDGGSDAPNVAESTAKPSQPPAHGRVPPAGTTARSNPVPESTPTPRITLPSSLSFGRWESDRHCLELRPNGDFELSVKGGGRNPKIVVRGHVIVPGGDVQAVEEETNPQGTSLTLMPSDIRRHRFVSRCRKNVISAGWLDETDVLGVPLTVDSASVLYLTDTDGGQGLRLCGPEDCVALVRTTPKLAGRWRLPAMADRGQWKPGQLLDVEVEEGDGRASSLWFATGPNEAVQVYGRASIASDGDDHFSVTFVASFNDERAEDPQLWGQSLAEGKTVEFRATRRPGFAIRWCMGTRCEDLPRFKGL